LILGLNSKGADTAAKIRQLPFQAAFPLSVTAGVKCQVDAITISLISNFSQRWAFKAVCSADKGAKLRVNTIADAGGQGLGIKRLSTTVIRVVCCSVTVGYF